MTRTPPTIAALRAVGAAALLLLTSGVRVVADEPGPARRLRQPVALAVVDEGRTLLVANRRSGSLSVVDTAARRVVAEHDLGRGLSDLAPLPDGRHLLAVDRESGELMLIEHRDRSARVVGAAGGRARPGPRGRLAGGGPAVVASTWPRRLTFVGLLPRTPKDPGPSLSDVGGLDLPFAPREMAVLPGGARLVVADAFGGRLAVVDLARRAIESVRSLPSHNIRGMAVSPDGRTLLMAHQYLNRLAQATFDDVHWGQLIRNHLRVLKVESLLAAGPDSALLDGGRLFDLGDVNYAAGDPGAIAFGRRGDLIVALEGMDELALSAGVGQGPAPDRRGPPTGRGGRQPGRRSCVRRRLARRHDLGGRDGDRPAAVDDRIGAAARALGGRPRRAAVLERQALARRLDELPELPHRRAHQRPGMRHARRRLLRVPKQVPSLLGVAATGPWTWTASMSRLEDQVRKSILTTMHGTKPTDAQVAELTAYLARLEPPAPRPANPGSDAAVARGREVFQSRKCATCHEPPGYTTPQKVDVGLVDDVGNREFNPPSLRAVGRRDAFLHDGRVKVLREVFAREHHPRGLELSPGEIDDLVVFLGTL